MCFLIKSSIYKKLYIVFRKTPKKKKIKNKKNSIL